MANYDNIRLEKGLYTTTKGFTNTLEGLDGSENYKGTALEGLDAYQRQLKRFNIKVTGADSDFVEKFFQTSDSAVLFPEYVSRAVQKGLMEANVLPRIIATKTTINGLDYRPIASVPSEADMELQDVDEGDLIPETEVKTQENLVNLQKRGRMLVASYEAVRFQRLDLFSVTLKQIGAYIARAQLKDAVDVLIGGDGNGNEADIFTVSGTNPVSYDNLINFWNLFSPYELNTIIASPDMMVKLLKLQEFKDAAAGLNFQGSGKMITPLGADFIKSGNVPEGTLIGLDKSCALEMVEAGDVSTEYDKLIDRQLERAAITTIAGFAKIFKDASRVMEIDV
ncbi:MAG: phage major capsid protein [Oscillospiraceae bacterium]|nr:phage major capsid protein [Oscillospiraceae bacterium]